VSGVFFRGLPRVTQVDVVAADEGQEQQRGHEQGSSLPGAGQGSAQSGSRAGQALDVEAAGTSQQQQGTPPSSPAAAATSAAGGNSFSAGAWRWSRLPLSALPLPLSLGAAQQHHNHHHHAEPAAAPLSDLARMTTLPGQMVSRAGGGGSASLCLHLLVLAPVYPDARLPAASQGRASCRSDRLLPAAAGAAGAAPRSVSVCARPGADRGRSGAHVWPNAGTGAPSAAARHHETSRALWCERLFSCPAPEPTHRWWSAPRRPCWSCPATLPRCCSPGLLAWSWVTMQPATWAQRRPPPAPHWSC